MKVYLLEQGHYDSTDVKRVFGTLDKGMKSFKMRYGRWSQDLESSVFFIDRAKVIAGAHKDHGTWAVLYEMELE